MSLLNLLQESLYIRHSLLKKKKAKMKCIYKTSILRTEYVLSQKIKNNFYAHKNIKDAY